MCIMHDSSKNYTDILLEQIRDQNLALLEAAATQATHDDITLLNNKVDKLSDDVEVIRAAVKDQSGELKDLEGRVTQLETSAA